MTGPRVDRAARRIAADPATVLRAWTDPALLARWLPPAGARARIDRHDLAEGGALRMTLIFDDDRMGKAGPGRDEVHGRFHDLTLTGQAPLGLTLAVDFPSDDPAYAGTMRMVWTFAPDPAGCLATVACHDVPPGIGQADHEAALASSLDNLAALFPPRGPAPTQTEIT